MSSLGNTSFLPSPISEHLQPLLATKDAKLIALNLDLYFMLFKLYLYAYFVIKGSPDRTLLGHRYRVLLFENSLICPTQTSSTELKAD